MSEELKKQFSKEYQYGFTTDIDSDQAPPGLDEGIIRFISAKKDEPKWMTDWRLAAYEKWQKLEEPKWAYLK